MVQVHAICLFAVHLHLASTFSTTFLSFRIRYYSPDVSISRCIASLPRSSALGIRISRRRRRDVTRWFVNTEESATASINEEESKEPLVQQYHADMRSVLDKRRPLLDPLLERSRNRQVRPVVLEHKSADLDGAQRAYSMLQRLISTNLATIESFEIVLEAFVHRDRMRWQNSTYNGSSHPAKGQPLSTNLICAADQAEAIWKQLNEYLSLKAQSSTIIPSSIYNLVLQAYANCASPRGEKNYADRAHQLYQHLQEVHKEQPESLVHVLHAYAWEQANLRPGKAAVRAQELLDRLDNSRVPSSTLLQCYDWVLEAWSKSGSSGSAERAQQLFTKMKDLNQTVLDASKHRTLDAETYSNLILAWSKDSSPESTQRCHNLLQELVEKYRSGDLGESEPPLIAFNGVIAAWGRAQRPDRAEQVLKLLQELRSSCQNLVPDVYSYNSVLNAYLRSTLPPEQILEKVTTLIEYMTKYSRSQPAIRPNSFTHFTHMKSLLQSGREDAAQRSDALLQEIERAWSRGDRSLELNNRIFNMVINSYAKSGQESGIRGALTILERMKSSKDFPPDNISYTSVLECMSKSSDPMASSKAQALLEELISRYSQTKDPSLKPNQRVFAMAILTFANTNGNVAQARNLLAQQIQLYEQTNDPDLRPNEYAYNYVLNCAANSLSVNPEQAFAIATETYQSMRQSSWVQPDSYTYAFWLKCCNKLLPNPSELRTKCISYAFEECRKNGLVSNEVLTRLFQGTPPQLVDQLLELQQRGTNYRALTVKDLPPSWSRNARKLSR